MSIKTVLIGFLPRHISPEQARNTGLAMVLLCLIISLAGGNQFVIKIALGLLLIDMVWPKFFLPIAIIWLCLANVMGSIISKIILAIIFFLMVTPLGFLKRHTGSEPLRLKEWKRSKNSVFTVRNRSYSASDLEKPY